MKVDIGDAEIVIGKRVSVGAAIGGIASVFGALFPEHAPAILYTVVPITFFIQILIAQFAGVTTKDGNVANVNEG
jgi:hypothetical protein